MLKAGGGGRAGGLEQCCDSAVMKQSAEPRTRHCFHTWLCSRLCCGLILEKVKLGGHGMSQWSRSQGRLSDLGVSLLHTHSSVCCAGSPLSHLVKTAWLMQTAACASHTFKKKGLFDFYSKGRVLERRRDRKVF